MRSVLVYGRNDWLSTGPVLTQAFQLLHLLRLRFSAFIPDDDSNSNYHYQ
jgi:hypothetical protein